MKEAILYVLRGEEFKSTQLHNDRFSITIMIVNPRKFHGTCGQRYSTIYYDAAFTSDISGKEFINTIIKPMATIGEKEIYVI
jgi:hypothetical protein